MARAGIATSVNCRHGTACAVLGRRSARRDSSQPDAPMERRIGTAMKWLRILYRAIWRLVMVDEGMELSGYIAFSAFLSLFPFLIFL